MRDEKLFVSIVGQNTVMLPDLIAGLARYTPKIATFPTVTKFAIQGRPAQSDLIILIVCPQPALTLRQIPRIKARAPGARIIVAGEQINVKFAVAAVKAGAFEVLEAPIRPARLAAVLEAAIAPEEAETRPTAPEQRRTPADMFADLLESFPGREALTSREIEVLQQIISGHSNKEAARDLGVSPRTIGAHRSRILIKLRARNAVELARAVFAGADEVA